jgi:glutamyl-tRNA(Gln) amidotransferase subunit D
MIEVKNLKTGDKVEIKIKDKAWTGNVLESYDAEIILLKLETGYNIGVRNSDIIEVKLLEKSSKTSKKPMKLVENKDLPNIAMIITGGTISSRLDPKTGAVTWTSVEDLFKIAPELQKICNITEVKKPFMKGSTDMSLKYWGEIAKTAHNLLLNKNIDGIIITHGTDTLHYGAASLSFFISNLNKPIAFTYSQRSIDRASTDAHLNLICAAKYATSDIAEIAVIGHKDLNDKECHALSGTKCRKMHTSRRDAFQAINDKPLANITKYHIEILKKFNPKSDIQPKLDTKYSDKVALIKVTPNQDPKILDYYADQGYKGLVLEATGLGHIPGKASDNNWLPTIKRLIKSGITLIAVPQTLHGQLNPNVYSYGRELQKTKIIFCKDILPETAFIKLSWILGHKAWTYNNKHRIKEILLENIAGEYNDSLGFEF